MKQKLYNIAHSRAGDKGNILTLSLIPYSEKDFELLRREVTVEKVKEHLCVHDSNELLGFTSHCKEERRSNTASCEETASQFIEEIASFPAIRVSPTTDVK